MPWNTDLIDTGVGRFYTQGDSTFQKYMWEDLSEYYLPNTRNTFDLTIYPMGNIAVNYEEIQINNHAITVGVVGDLSAGEYEQWFYNHPTSGAVFWNSQEDDPVEIAGGDSICSVIPDSHISCLYYPQVYADNVYNQQCDLDPLYDYGCDGWDDAYIEEYVEPEEEEVWEEEEEIYQPYVPEEPPIFIEYDVGPIEVEIEMPMVTEYEMELPEIEMEEFTQETMMAEIEAEMEEYFDPLPETEPMEEMLEEPIEELDEPEPEEDTLQEEQTEEEQEQEEVIEEESEEEETEEVEEEVEEEREETEPEPEVEAVKEEPKVVEKKKKASKRDKMREIISKKLQSLAVEMGEAASLEEQQKLQSLILALLNFNAGFNSYNTQMLIDGEFYTDEGIYLDKDIPDNQRGLRNGLANEILHKKLVDLQWQK